MLPLKAVQKGNPRCRCAKPLASKQWGFPSSEMVFQGFLSASTQLDMIRSWAKRLPPPVRPRALDGDWFLSGQVLGKPSPAQLRPPLAGSLSEHVCSLPSGCTCSTVGPQWPIPGWFRRMMRSFSGWNSIWTRQMAGEYFGGWIFPRALHKNLPCSPNAVASFNILRLAHGKKRSRVRTVQQALSQ